jgi:hypothetical protein
MSYLKKILVNYLEMMVKFNFPSIQNDSRGKEFENEQAKQN